MSSSSFPGSPGSVQVTISSDDGASELSLINDAYNVVGQGIGQLNIALPPGQYQLRQSIGDSEFIKDIEVPLDYPTVGDLMPGHLTFKFEGPKFSSPAPIEGTTTFRDVPRDLWKKPDTLVGRPGLRLVVRDPGNEGTKTPPTKTELAHLQAEVARLRLETMQGELIFDFGKNSPSTDLSETATFLQDLEVAPGHYVLVQSVDGTLGGEGHQPGRQRCLPLIVHKDFAPRVYLLSLIDRRTRAPVPVDLDKASIMYWPMALGTSPGQQDLTRLEAARKALERGQAIGGYWAAARSSAEAPVLAPMLALMDAYLLLANAPKTDSDVPGLSEAVNAAEKALGPAFPDVLALRYAIEKRGSNKSDEQNEFELNGVSFGVSGPPLLAQSWRQLLAVERTNAMLSRVMPFEFVPETSGTWFTWNEDVVARKRVEDVPGFGQIALNALTSWMDRKGVPNDDAFNAGNKGRTVPDAESSAASHALDAAAIGLVILMKDKVVSDLVTRLNKLVAEQESLPSNERLDPMVVQFITGLATMQNRLLLDAFGPQDLAKKILLGLRIPSDKLPHLLKSLTATLKKNDLIKSAVSQLAESLGNIFKKFGGN